MGSLEESSKIRKALVNQLRDLAFNNQIKIQ